jgi:hypothetical protein
VLLAAAAFSMLSAAPATQSITLKLAHGATPQQVIGKA